MALTEGEKVELKDLLLNKREDESKGALLVFKQINLGDKAQAQAGRISELLAKL